MKSETLLMFVLIGGLLHVVLGTVHNEHKTRTPGIFQKKGTGHGVLAAWESTVLDYTQGLRQWGVCSAGPQPNISSGPLETARNIPLQQQGIATAHWLSAGLLIPLASACALAWKTNWNKPIALGTYDAGLLFMYMVVCASSRVVMHGTKGSAVQSTIAACFLLNALKAILSLMLLILKQSMSFGAVLEVLRQKEGNMHFPVWCHIAFVAALLCGNEALTLFVLQLLPPLSFQLLLNCIIVVIVPLQWWFLDKKISTLQSLSLLLLVIGGGALCVGGSIANSSDHDHQSRGKYILGIALMFMKIIMAASALVLKEKLLKELPLTVDANNLVSYCFSMAFLVVAMISWAFGMSSTAAMVQQDVMLAFAEVFTNPWMLGSVLLLSIYGIMVTYLLKARSALEKEIASIGVIGILAAGPAFAGLSAYKGGFAFHTIECTLIITICSLAYLMNEPTKPAKPASQHARWCTAHAPRLTTS